MKRTFYARERRVVCHECGRTMEPRFDTGNYRCVEACCRDIYHLGSIWLHVEPNEVFKFPIEFDVPKNVIFGTSEELENLRNNRDFVVFAIKEEIKLWDSFIGALLPKKLPSPDCSYRPLCRLYEVVYDEDLHKCAKCPAKIAGGGDGCNYAGYDEFCSAYNALDCGGGGYYTTISAMKMKDFMEKALGHFVYKG